MGLGKLILSLEFKLLSSMNVAWFWKLVGTSSLVTKFVHATTFVISALNTFWETIGPLTLLLLHDKHGNQSRLYLSQRKHLEFWEVLDLHLTEQSTQTEKPVKANHPATDPLIVIKLDFSAPHATFKSTISNWGPPSHNGNLWHEDDLSSLKWWDPWQHSPYKKVGHIVVNSVHAFRVSNVTHRALLKFNLSVYMMLV